MVTDEVLPETAIAPPAERELLFLNVEFLTINLKIVSPLSFPASLIKRIAPPTFAVLLFSKVQFSMIGAPSAIYIAPPPFSLSPVKLL